MKKKVIAYNIFFPNFLCGAEEKGKCSDRMTGEGAGSLALTALEFVFSSGRMLCSHQMASSILTDTSTPSLF